MKKFTKWTILILVMNIVAQLTVPISAEEDSSAQVEQSTQEVMTEDSNIVMDAEATSMEPETSNPEDKAEESPATDEANQEETTEATEEPEDTSEEATVEESYNIVSKDWIDLDDSHVTSTTTSIKGRIDIDRILNVMVQHSLTEPSWKELLETSLYNQDIQLWSDGGTLLSEAKIDSFSRFNFSNLELIDTQSLTFVMDDIKLTYQVDNIVKEVVISSFSKNVAVQQVAEEDLQVETNDEESSQKNTITSTANTAKVGNVHVVTNSSTNIDFGTDWLTDIVINPEENKITGKLNKDNIYKMLRDVNWKIYENSMAGDELKNTLMGLEISLFLNKTRYEGTGGEINKDWSFSFDIPNLSKVNNVTLGFSQDSGTGSGTIELEDPLEPDQFVYFTFHNILVEVPESNKATLTLTLLEDSIDLGNIPLTFGDIASTPVQTQSPLVEVSDTRDSKGWSLSLKPDLELVNGDSTLKYELSSEENPNLEWTSCDATNEVTEISLGSDFSINISNPEQAIEGQYSTNFHWELSDTQ